MNNSFLKVDHNIKLPILNANQPVLKIPQQNINFAKFRNFHSVNMKYSDSISQGDSMNRDFPDLSKSITTET